MSASPESLDRRQCPFCGQPVCTTILEESQRDDIAGWRAACAKRYNIDACGARGPVALTPDEAMRRFLKSPRATCHICGKEKGQPPDRCPGHYTDTPSDPRILQG